MKYLDEFKMVLNLGYCELMRHGCFYFLLIWGILKHLYQKLSFHTFTLDLKISWIFDRTFVYMLISSNLSSYNFFSLVIFTRSLNSIILYRYTKLKEYRVVSSILNIYQTINQIFFWQRILVMKKKSLFHN